MLTFCLKRKVRNAELAFVVIKLKNPEVTL
jgi:hypothetical protein